MQTSLGLRCLRYGLTEYAAPFLLVPLTPCALLLLVQPPAHLSIATFLAAILFARVRRDEHLAANRADFLNFRFRLPARFRHEWRGVRL